MAETDDRQAQLDALRASGAAERDPIRFAYLDALARRAATQAAPIRQLLDAKIRAVANEIASRPAFVPTKVIQTNAASPLANLLTYINQHAHEQSEANQAATQTAAVNPALIEISLGESSRAESRSASAARTRQAPELKSVAYFRNEWSKLSTEQQLTQTLAQAPENAGPMNAQHLVLRSLQVMHDISPDYLQGFMSYIDTLIWLEHADPTKLLAGRSSASEGENKARTAKRRVRNR